MYQRVRQPSSAFKGEFNLMGGDIGGVGGLEMMMEDDPSQLPRFNQEAIQWELEDFKDFSMF